MKPFAYARPGSTGEVLKLLSATARPKGGGYDLLDLAKNGVSTPGTMVDLRGVEGLDAIEAADGSLRIGPRVTLAALAASADVRRLLPALAEAAAGAATPLVRNTATVAGNLLQRPRCTYFRDPFFDCRKRGGKECPALEGDHAEGAVFMNARCCAVHPSNLAVALAAAGGEAVILQAVDPKTGAATTRNLRLDGNFFVSPKEDLLREARLEPGELVIGIVAKAAPRSAYVEVDQKASFDWASASAAVVLDMEGDRVKRARVALGAVAPIPLLSPGAVAALIGKVPDGAAAAAAGDAAAKEATPLRDNGHKVQHLRVCVQRAVLAAAARGR